MGTITVEFANSKKIEKEIKSLPNNVQKEIFKALEGLSNFPNIINCKKISGSIKDIPTPAFRLRVRNCRILFTFERKSKIIIVYRIKQRKEAYL